MKFSILIALLTFVSTQALAKQYEIFDGQFYNGLYYPLVDQIEWGEQYGELPHLEFHIHSDKQIELAVVAGEKNGKPMVWMMYDLRFRGEKICRSMLAPRQFREGTKLYAYKDTHDPDYVNILISSEPRKDKHFVEYAMPAYEPCTDELATNKPDVQVRGPASVPVPASELAADSSKPEKKEGKNIGVDYDNSAVPFSF